MDIKIKEQKYITTHFKERSKLLENIRNILSKKTILKIDNYQYHRKRHNREYVRNICIIKFENGDILDIRTYSKKYGDTKRIHCQACSYENKKWKWLGSVVNDEMVFKLTENIINKLKSLKEELNNKVDNELKKNYERYYISRG